MNALFRLMVNSVQLNLRNRMAMIYGYIFPLIFLAAFWTIYRHDRVPLLFHIGELLTVTLLGGACFGLPTTMVSERERGVWRRYRLSPAPTWTLVTNVLVTRYLLVITAALLQIGIAVAIGMTSPRHPFELLVAFSVSAIAFLGIGLQIAMLADSVPAVQALGQCVFLPMLMIGGVAVPLVSLPHWAVVLSACFPGRYSVHAIQTAMTGAGLSTILFDLLCLAMFGLAGMVTAVCYFRWSPTASRSPARKKSWLALALLVWLGVGLAAQRTGRVTPQTFDEQDLSDQVGVPRVAVTQQPATASPTLEARAVGTPPTTLKSSVSRDKKMAIVSQVSRWQDVTEAQIQSIAFDRLPPDGGLVTPVAHSGEVSEPDAASQLEQIRQQLTIWAPGKVVDPVQRARNDLYVAGVPDLLEMASIERFVPLLVFSRIRADIPATDLPKILYWIAAHPDEGEDSALDDMDQLGLPVPTGRKRAVRGRVMVYAMKLLGRQTGAIVPQ